MDAPSTRFRYCSRAGMPARHARYREGLECRTYSVKTNPWVDHADEHIHGKIDSDYDRDREQRNTLDRCVVTIENRVDHQAAKRRAIKYRLCDDCASQTAGEIRPYDGYDSDQGFSQSLFNVRFDGAESLGSVCPDVVLVDD